MINVLRQKSDLGILKIDDVPIEAIDGEIEFIFALAECDLSNPLLVKELDEIEKRKIKNTNVLFTRFPTKYALFKEDMEPLPEFRNRLKKNK